MGFLDRFKNTFDRVSTEETVMNVSYDTEEDYKKTREEILRNDRFLGEELGELPNTPSEPVDTVFSVDEEFDYIKQTEEHKYNGESLQKSFDSILTFLGIEKDINVPDDVFMVADLENIEFSIETPHGFERGEVRDYQEQTKKSIEYYINALTQRNDDVKKLVKELDRVNREKQDLLLNDVLSSNNISIETTTDLDAENQRLSSENKQLKNRLHELQSGGKLSETERDRFNKIQDSLSVKDREIQDLRDEIYILKVEKEELIEEQTSDLDRLVENEYNEEEMPDILDDYTK